jgi:hypothetical protein
MIDRHQQAIGFDQFIPDLLQQVLDVCIVRHTTANEIAQPEPLFRDDLGDSPILFKAWLSHRCVARRLMHPLM